MAQAPLARQPFDRSRWMSLVVLASVVLMGGATAGLWLPWLKAWLAPVAVKPADDHEHEPAEHHGHEHAGHSEENSLELSLQARASIGLKVGEIKLSEFERTITIPGLVVERRGRSRVAIVAPLTGVVTRIYPIEGEAVAPARPLFEMRLTHEELVQSQADLLKTAEELDVIKREIARLEIATKDGGVAGKTILDRKYELQKGEALLRAQRQALLLHGLSNEQVDRIVHDRTLLGTLTIRVPTDDSLGMELPSQTVLQVQELKVERGQHVTAGELIAVLSDHAELLIEGEAFEQDAALASQAVAKERRVSAVLETRSGQPTTVEGLSIQHLANRIEPTSRALHVYVTLPNELLRESEKDGRKFVEWRYKPGQRMSLRVPVEHWTERIVLPVEAVAVDGVENYVFQANGDHFDRRPVKVEFRDPLFVVIASDGGLAPQDLVAMSGAQQLQLALKNKSGGPIDPHAGHNH